MTSSNGNIFRATGHLCGEFTGHRWIPRTKPVTRSFDVFFHLRLNKRLSKQSWARWFETPSCSFWRHCNELDTKEHVKVIFHLNFKSVHSRICIWKCRMRKRRTFCHGLNMLTHYREHAVEKACWCKSMINMMYNVHYPTEADWRIYASAN